jgi:ATP-binding cassette subfamily A (ABC1) protein 3
LKGIPEDLRARMVNKQIKEMDLESYRNIRANNLSGGNKRKLSVAMAMIGNPPLVFLDEPSTGVDP